MAGKWQQQLVKRVTVSLRKLYGRPAAATKRPALDELLLGILDDGVSEKKALAALAALSRWFVDWNEVRVASPAEVAALISGIPEASAKARAIKSVLHRIYALTHDMSLEFLREKQPREVSRVISGIENFPEGALARATIYGLGQPVMPLTPKVSLVCRRLGLLDGGSRQKALTRQLECIVLKQNMFEVHWLLSRHADAICRRRTPGCADCKLNGICRNGKRVLKKRKQGSAAAKRKKSRK